jgi:hypothetical protein
VRVYVRVCVCIVRVQSKHEMEAIEAIENRVRDAIADGMAPSMYSMGTAPSMHSMGTAPSMAMRTSRASRIATAAPHNPKPPSEGAGGGGNVATGVLRLPLSVGRHNDDGHRDSSHAARAAVEEGEARQDRDTEISVTPDSPRTGLDPDINDTVFHPKSPRRKQSAHTHASTHTHASSFNTNHGGSSVKINQDSHTSTSIHDPETVQHEHGRQRADAEGGGGGGGGGAGGLGGQEGDVWDNQGLAPSSAQRLLSEVRFHSLLRASE